jgi:hypothetical protein
MFARYVSSRGCSLIATALLLWGISLLATTCFAQDPSTGSAGNNAVYNSSAACCKGTASFIDASVFLGTGAQHGSDFCDVVYQIFNGQITTSYTSSGAVIDARGFNGGSLTCAKGTPWNEGGAYFNKPSTILLPAGTINIAATWVLPSGTHLIGAGTSDPDLSSGATTIHATSNFVTQTPMIQFGDSAHCATSTLGGCTDISVEHLVLDADDGSGQNGLSVTGIRNYYAQEHSSVDHVTLYHIIGVGLDIGASGAYSATNSGPYSNIHYESGNNATSTTVCAQIRGLSGTKGIHGLTCEATANPTWAVLLDSSNNTLEDIRTTGFYSGVMVGSKASASANVLKNIIGDKTVKPNATTPVNAVHISAAHPVTDLVILGASNLVTGNDQYTIYDDVTGTHLASGATDSTVAMYVLGQGKSGQGHSRYTTSPNTATWGFGNGVPAAGSCTSSNFGSLYSCTGTAAQCTPSGQTTPAGLWGCSLTTGWTVVK